MLILWAKPVLFFDFRTLKIILQSISLTLLPNTTSGLSSVETDGITAFVGLSSDDSFLLV